MQMPIINKRNSSGGLATNPVSELFARRIVWLVGPVDDETATGAIQQLSYLDSSGDDPIHLYVNSPGGSVTAGLALVDCMRGLASPVHTHAFGLAASMGATILACGEKGHRTATPNCRLLIHQPLAGGIGGQATDIEIAVKNLSATKVQLEGLLAKACDVAVEDVCRATDRDNWMTPEEALDFGLIDGIEDAWMNFED